MCSTPERITRFASLSYEKSPVSVDPLLTIEREGEDASPVASGDGTEVLLDARTAADCSTRARGQDGIRAEYPELEGGDARIDDDPRSQRGPSEEQPRTFFEPRKGCARR